MSRYLLDLLWFALGTAMTRRSFFLATAAVATIFTVTICTAELCGYFKILPGSIDKQFPPETKNMTTNGAIVIEVDNFVAQQNQNRGLALAGGGTLPLDYDALTGSVPAGGNAVTGISGIAAGAAGITLPGTQHGNAVIIDGAISATASISGADSYSLLVSTSGLATVTDNNTGYSETIADASYLVFDGGATTSTGAYQSAYLIETGVMAEVASMYNAAFGRVPDFAGLEYNGIPAINGVLDLHQTGADFLASPEFASRYPALTKPADNGGPNDQAFITELYGQILHRTPSTAEVQYYVEALQGALTTSTGAAIPGVDRAQLLVYFSISPENQADVSAANGGWLINPANGTVSFGEMSTATASTVLASEAASGVVNASDFANLSSSAQIIVSGVTIVGANYGAGSGVQQADPEIATANPNTTINLSSQYYFGSIYGSNDTLNGVPTGGSIVATPSAFPSSTYVNDGGTVNLFGNLNWVQFGNPSYAVTVATVINGWNSTDVIVAWGGAFPSYFNSAASLLASPDGFVFQGSASNPVHGTAMSFSNANAVNVGSIANDSVSTMVAAANQIYKVAEASSENVFFFGQDPQGNTMVYWWRGDHSNVGTVQASDITGAIELVGVQASSLTAANFHH